MQTMTQYTLLIIVWIAWCALHSALVSLSLTEPLRKRFPYASRYYRIVYNVVSVVTLAPVLLYTFSLRGTPIFSWQGPWRFVQIALTVSALVFFVAGARHYDLFQFLGLRQLKDEKACSVLTDDCSLDTSGVSEFGPPPLVHRGHSHHMGPPPRHERNPDKPCSHRVFCGGDTTRGAEVDSAIRTGICRLPATGLDVSADQMDCRTHAKKSLR